MLKIFLKPAEEKQIRQGSPWVFDNEIGFVRYESGGKICTSLLDECAVPDGEVAEVYSKSGLFLGCGVVNRRSKITVRLLSRIRETFDVDFFVRRIETALAARFLFYHKSDSYRLIYGEADFIPGLIAERYCDEQGRVFVVVQFLTLGAEVFRAEIVEALRIVCRPYGMYERSDVSVRTLEGLDERKGWIGAEHDPVITIRENGIRLTVDIENGQKTGYFLDQKDNRRLVASVAKGRRVLDAIAHTGEFGLNDVSGCAREVIAADISADAVEAVRANAALNKMSGVMTAVCADVFDLLKEYEKAGEKFDMIVLDPPAFTKSAKMTEKAYGGYKEINLRAMKLLNPGGILVTCSCSYFFGADMFYGMLTSAAEDAHRQVQVLEKRSAGADHPVLLGYARSDYLKCAVLRVL